MLVHSRKPNCLQMPQRLLFLFPPHGWEAAGPQLALLWALPLRMLGPEVPGWMTHIRAHADASPDPSWP